MRVLLAFELGLIDPNELFPAASVFAETIVTDPVEPRRELRFAAKAADVFVSFEERFLGEIIREGSIGACELTQHTADRGLMAPHELREGVVVFMKENSGDEVCIRQ